MSQITRQDIADAINSVDGVTGSAVQPRTPGRGQGWPVWVRSSTPSTLAGDDEVTWYVIITLPAGLDDATILEADALTGQIINALAPLGAIEQYEPNTIVLQEGAQGLPIIQVTLSTM